MFGGSVGPSADAVGLFCDRDGGNKKPAYIGGLVGACRALFDAYTHNAVFLNAHAYYLAVVVFVEMPAVPRLCRADGVGTPSAGPYSVCPFWSLFKNWGL